MDLNDFDYFRLTKEAKKVNQTGCHKTTRVAFLADCSTQHLIPLVQVLLFRIGVYCECYEAQFDAISQEVYDETSALYQFKPDVIIVLNCVNALRHTYNSFEGPGSDFTTQLIDRMRGIWKGLKKNSSAIIIQSNFVIPYDRVFGHYELKADASFYAAVARLNSLIAESSKSDDTIFMLDVDYIASYVGRQRWFDEKLWLLAKAPAALECLPALAHGLVSFVKAARGIQIVKCIILDLDNTMWGGVIGDDGLEGIRLGDLEDGQAYKTFQHFLLALKKRGILLAACSRNDMHTALLPFHNHPDMVLKENDFSVFVANYQNKADNIRAIQKQLNIGFDSMLFIDDDPFERNLIRSSLPEVQVPEMPSDPANYVKALCEMNLFETVSFSEEDRQRTQIYQVESKRKVLQESFTNMDDYLKSLSMGAVLKRFDPFHLPRIAQLLSRSNQFNLTTSRYSLADCERFMMETSVYHPYYMALKDKLGDSGLIGAFILEQKADTIEILEWVMSCRVLLRGVEQFTMNAIFDVAKKCNAKRVLGRYRPTAKNAMVKDIFAQFSFSKISEEKEGASVWELDIKRYAAKPTFIQTLTEVN